MVSIGVFSDIHGDRSNLELIVASLKELGVDSTLFLGDAIYKTMADVTLAELQKAAMLKAQLGQKVSLRDDFLNGLFSDAQLERYTEAYKRAGEIGTKVARAEYERFKEALSGLDARVLGGNWDYTVMADVFGTDYLNASKTELAGLNVLGFSGGGSPSVMTASDATVSDDPASGRMQARSWASVLGKVDRDLEADVLVSHVPFTDGEGIQTEQSVEQLKHLVSSRRQARLQAGKADDVPNVFIWGHRHNNGQVEYDEELGGLIINPGCSSRNHNEGVPTFMVADFGDDKKIVAVHKYEIRGMFQGKGRVTEVGVYTIGNDGKSVAFQPTGKVKKEYTIEATVSETLGNSLSLDDNLSLTQAGLDTNYDLIRNDPRALDAVLRNNIMVMQKDVQQTVLDLRGIIEAANAEFLVGSGKIDYDTMTENLRTELTQLACKKLGANYELVRESEFGIQIARSLMINILGIDLGKLLHDVPTEKVDSADKIVAWGKQALDAAQRTTSQSYQQFIFDGLTAGDYQAMAELSMPAALERKKIMTPEGEVEVRLDDQKAWGLWLTSYQHGLIDSKTALDSGAYQLLKDFVGTRRTRDNLAAAFGVPAQTLDDTVAADTDSTSTLRTDGQVSPEELRKKVESGEFKVVESNGQQYVVDPLTDTVLSDTASLGLGPGSYDVLDPQQYQDLQRQNLITQNPTQPPITYNPTLPPNRNS